MTWIRVDPDELTGTASVLQGSATELADLGSGISAECGSCCVPAGVEGEIRAAAAAVTACLGGIASDLGAAASDLSQRGALAANDSLGTAASAASGPAAGTDTGTVGMTDDWLASMDSPVVSTSSGWAVTGGDWLASMGTPVGTATASPAALTGSWLDPMSGPAVTSAIGWSNLAGPTAADLTGGGGVGRLNGPAASALDLPQFTHPLNQVPDPSLPQVNDDRASQGWAPLTEGDYRALYPNALPVFGTAYTASLPAVQDVFGRALTF